MTSPETNPLDWLGKVVDVNMGDPAGTTEHTSTPCPGHVAGYTTVDGNVLGVSVIGAIDDTNCTAVVVAVVTRAETNTFTLVADARTTPVR